jgi:hypothetical protein
MSKATNQQHFERRPYRSSTMSRKVVCIGIVCACCALCAIASIYVWIPDLFRGETILAKVGTPSGDVLRVTQEFAGDGYDTRFYHTNKSGRAWLSGFDGDARKEFRCKIHLDENGKVSIAVLGQRFVYNLQSHELTDEKGKPRFVLEVPEDGSSPFFLGAIRNRR